MHYMSVKHFGSDRHFKILYLGGKKKVRHWLACPHLVEREYINALEIACGRGY